MLHVSLSLLMRQWVDGSISSKLQDKEMSSCVYVSHQHREHHANWVPLSLTLKAQKLPASLAIHMDENKPYDCTNSDFNIGSAIAFLF